MRELWKDLEYAVRQLRRSPGFALTAVDKARLAEGRLVIYFADAPVALTGWNQIDARGRITRVRLSRLQPQSGLDPSLFVLRDPRKAAPAT